MNFRSTLLCLPLMILVGQASPAGDWPQWRGPSRDAKSTESGLLTEWPEDGPPLAWRVDGVGGGYSSVSVANGRIYTLGDLEDGVYAIALSEKDGSSLWKTRLGEPGGHRGYPGPRSSPTVDGGQVFVLNQHGDLVCLDEQDGGKIWSVNLEKDFGGRMMSGWRYSESPLVDGDMVVCTPGGKNGTVLALNRNSGEKVWQTTDWTDTAGYSSVIIKEIEGVRQYVQLTGKSVAGINPKTGDILWRADRPGKTAVVATPVVEGNTVFVTSAYGVGCSGFSVRKSGDSWNAELKYANKAISNHHGGVVLLNGHVYGSSGGSFRCMNLETGENAYEGRSAGKGATVFADGHLYLRAESGPVALIEATPDGLKEKGRFNQPDRSKRAAWAHPVVANGKLYLRDQGLLLCYDVKAK